MRRRHLTLTLSAAFAAAISLLAPPRAQATDPGLYISLKYGTTDVDASYGDVFKQAINGDDESKTVEVGYRWSPHFAIQGGYHDFGDVPGFGTPCRGDDQACVPIDVPLRSETKAYSLALVPQLPLGNRLSVFVKVGAIALDTEIRDSSDVADFAEDFSDEDVLWGAGLRLTVVGPLQIFYEYEGIGEDFKTQSFGATWQF